MSLSMIYIYIHFYNRYVHRICRKSRYFHGFSSAGRSRSPAGGGAWPGRGHGGETVRLTGKSIRSHGKPEENDRKTIGKP